MDRVRTLAPDDLDGVIARVAQRLQHDASRNPFINPAFSTAQFEDSLRAAAASTWVALDGGHLCGHLFGAVLKNEAYGHGVWTGPDGCSYDSPDTLADLYSHAGREWIDSGALEHYVWVFDGLEDTAAWHELGFARMHQRGVLSLSERRGHDLAKGYTLRRGSLDDLDVAIDLMKELDRLQESGPSFSINVAHTSMRDDLIETLEDPEVRFYLVEAEGTAIAQCMTFPLPEQRGSFPETVHLSAVVVREAHRGRGVATALVDAALDEARAEGFEFAETNWRVTNRLAAGHWRRYGFRPTYVRLHRTIGAG